MRDLGNPANFQNAKDGYVLKDYSSQSWYKNLKEYNENQPGRRVESHKIIDENGNVSYEIHVNGVKDEVASEKLNEAMKGTIVDRSIEAISKFLDVIGNVFKVAGGTVATIAGVLGTVGGCALVSIAGGGVGVLVDGVIVEVGLVVTGAGVALTVDGVLGLTTSNFASNGGAGEKRSWKKIPKSLVDEQARKQGFDDAHDFKKPFVKGNVSKFNMVYDTETGEIFLQSIQGNIIVETGYFYIK